MSSECREAALAIGRTLAGEALWHEGRCNWVGAVGDEHDPWRLEYRALGADLYGGTAGVGLALAQLGCAGGDALLRGTAAGALRHALGAARPPCHGFHNGTTGIAWAAAQGARLLGDDALDVAARGLVSALPTASPRPLDLIGGVAGTVHGLLALGLAEQAAAHGEALLTAARIDRHGWSWPGPGGQRLCGAAHGVAGIGWTLAALHGATGDMRFRDAAAGAFAFVHSWLDPASGTWPDLRVAGQRRDGRRILAEHAIGTWCHGEAGIALARRHARAWMRLDADNDEATAIATTARRVAFATAGALEDLTLCHGLGGAVDVLLDAGPSHADEARTLVHGAVDRYRTPSSWPCGDAGAQPPGLFLGLAGVAWLLLRAEDSTVPTPLAAVDVIDTST
jgi:lantibiotic modifying enzyme